MDGLENAAAAFDVAMGNSPTPKSGGSNEVKARPEPIFDNMGVLENGEEAAGGDRLPNPKPKKAAPVVEEDDDNYIGDDELDPDEEEEVEDEEEADEEAEDEEDDEEGDGSVLDTTVKVMVDGEEEEVTVKEALNGYIRVKTFHKRLNEVTEAGKVVETAAQKVVEDRNKVFTMLEEAEQILSSVIPAEPDWDALFAADPAQARTLQKQYDNYKKQVDDIRKKRADAVTKAAQDAQEEKVQFARAEFPKFANYAKWRNKDDMLKDTKSMRRTALSTGFTEQEVAEVLDHRMLVVLLKASKYDRMMAAKPKPVKTGKTPMTPGAGSKRTAHKGITGAQKQLSRTGSVEDAASVFAQMIK